jgi:hypothetical protein
MYRMAIIKRNACLGWEIFKIESMQMRGICFLKSGNTVKPVSSFYSVTKLKKTNLSFAYSPFKKFPNLNMGSVLFSSLCIFHAPKNGNLEFIASKIAPLGSTKRTAQTHRLTAAVFATTHLKQNIIKLERCGYTKETYSCP